jgi:hypothetical protein
MAALPGRMITIIPMNPITAETVSIIKERLAVAVKQRTGVTSSKRTHRPIPTPQTAILKAKIPVWLIFTDD